MRLTSLRREVNRVTRGTGEEVRKRDPLRWLVLLAVFCATVVLTSPFYLFKPSVPAVGEKLTGPVKAETDFHYVLQSSQDQFEKERRQFHKRVYHYDAEVRQRVMQELDRLYSTTDSLDRGGPPAEVLASLRRVDSRLGFLSESDVPRFLTFVPGSALPPDHAQRPQEHLR
jgi:hypothetical protein